MYNDEDSRRVHLVEIRENYYKVIISYIALFVSIVTASVVIWQGFEQRNYYRKVVSPFIIPYTTYTPYEKEWGISLQNEGLGPAVITFHKMTIDNMEKSPEDILDQMIEEDVIEHKGRTVRRLMGDKPVLKAGSKTPILIFHPLDVNPNKIGQFGTLINRRINLIYSWCDVYGACQKSCTAFNCEE